MYTSSLALLDTQRAIKDVKDCFIENLARELKLTRVSAPLFVTSDSGLNDNLNGVERAVNFDIKQTGVIAEVVHSLAKWKRFALHKYGFKVGEGLYADMNAIRRDEICDDIHSLYVDQWDWELVIDPQQRNLVFLKSVVDKIYRAIRITAKEITAKYDVACPALPKEIAFVSTQSLEDEFPSLTPTQRENEIAKRSGAVFVSQIGGTLKSGEKHDGRAPDYDDWTLNGDIFVWDETLGRGMELSSMGIRVDKDALLAQLESCGATDRLRFPFHKALVEGKLPLTIGGGIGQSRLCMFILGKAHIGEVQQSVWPQEEIDACLKRGIELL